MRWFTGPRGIAVAAVLAAVVGGFAGTALAGGTGSTPAIIEGSPAGVRVGTARAATPTTVAPANAAIAAVEAYDQALADADATRAWAMLTPAAQADWGSRREFARYVAEASEGASGRVGGHLTAEVEQVPDLPGHWLVRRSGKVTVEGESDVIEFSTNVDLTGASPRIEDLASADVNETE
jgi:hypothetical protein